MKKLCPEILLFLFLILQGCSSSFSDKGDPAYTSVMADLYQKNLSSISFVRKGECPMHPSCSQFAKESYSKFGFVLGTVLTSERLMRCGRDCLKKLKIVNTERGLKFYDPVPFKLLEEIHEKN